MGPQSALQESACRFDLAGLQHGAAAHAFADLTIDQNLEMITPGLSAQVRVAYDNSAEITDMRTCDFAYMEVSSANDEIGNVKELLYTPYGNNRNMEFNSKLSTSINRTSVWAKFV